MGLRHITMGGLRDPYNRLHAEGDDDDQAAYGHHAIVVHPLPCIRSLDIEHLGGRCMV